MGRNHTGPSCNVGHPTAHAPGEAAADRPRGQPVRPPAALQTTDISQQNNGPLGGPVMNLKNCDWCLVKCITYSTVGLCIVILVRTRHYVVRVFKVPVSRG